MLTPARALFRLVDVLLFRLLNQTVQCDQGSEERDVPSDVVLVALELMVGVQSVEPYGSRDGFILTAVFLLRNAVVCFNERVVA